MADSLKPPNRARRYRIITRIRPSRASTSGRLGVRDARAPDRQRQPEELEPEGVGQHRARPRPHEEHAHAAQAQAQLVRRRTGLRHRKGTVIATDSGESSQGHNFTDHNFRLHQVHRH